MPRLAVTRGTAIRVSVPQVSFSKKKLSCRHRRDLNGAHTDVPERLL